MNDSSGSCGVKLLTAAVRAMPGFSSDRDGCEDVFDEDVETERFVRWVTVGPLLVVFEIDLFSCLKCGVD